MMKRKITCLLLCLCLCISLLPVAALAVDAGYGLYVGGVEITEENKDNITAAVPGASGTAFYDSSSNTLTLNKFVYKGIGQPSSDRSAIRYENGTELKIVLKGKNQLGANVSFPEWETYFDVKDDYLAHGIVTDSPLTVSGSGSLHICSLSSCIISTGGDIRFGTNFSGMLTAHCGREYDEDRGWVDISCIEAYDGNVSVLGGSMSLSSDAGSGISAYNDTYGDDGYTEDRNVTISDAVVKAAVDGNGVYVRHGALSIDSGSVTLNTKEEGVYISSGKLQISGGTVSIIADDVENPDFTSLDGIYVRDGIAEVSGGKLDIFGGNSGLYVSYGDLTVSGGQLTVGTRGIAICCDHDDEDYGYDGSITVTGGQITAESEDGIGIWACEGDLTVSGGEVTVSTGEGACLCSEDGDVLISGGTVTVSNTGDENDYSFYYEYPAISSRYGDITVSGGTVTSSSALSEAIYSAEGDISITGGLTTAESASVSAVKAANDGTITTGESVLIKAGESKGAAVVKEDGEPYDGEKWVQFGVPYPVWVGGTQVTGLNRDDVLGDGTVSYVPASGDIAAVLTLNNADIGGYATFFSPPSYGIYADEDLILNLIGENKVCADPETAEEEDFLGMGYNAIGLGVMPGALEPPICDLTVIGTDSLEAIGNITSLSSVGICLTGTFRLDSGTVTAGAANGLLQAFGIAAQSLEVNGGTLTAYGKMLPVEGEEEPGAAEEPPCAAIRSNDVSVAESLQVKAGTASDGSNAVKVTDLAENCGAYRYVKIGTERRSGGGTTSKPEPADNPLPFSDVAEDRWSCEDIAFCYKNGLMVGISDILFDPTGTTTRAQLAVILYRMAGEPAFMNDNIFDDVVSGSYYEKAVIWASGKGIVNGYDNGSFGPNDPVTREQMAVMFYRYSKYIGIDVSVDENTNFLSFNDFWDISEYAKSAMMWVIENGLIAGDGQNLLPQGQATREQTTAILHRFCDIENHYF